MQREPSIKKTRMGTRILEAMSSFRKVYDLVEGKQNKDYIETLWINYSQRWEMLSIHWEGINKKKGILFFVLAGDVWYPCSGGEITRHGIHNPCLSYRIDYEDGSVEYGMAAWGEWAYCAADNTPHIPFGD